MNKKLAIALAAIFTIICCIGCGQSEQQPLSRPNCAVCAACPVCTDCWDCLDHPICRNCPFCDPDEPDSKDMHKFFDGYPESEKQVVVIRQSSWNYDNFVMVTSLQGIVAKTNPSIFINVDSMTHLDYIMNSYAGYSYTQINDVWELVAMFKEYLNDNGFVVYRRSTQDIPSNPSGGLAPDHFNDTLNAAATISGLESYLMVSDGNIERAMEAGLTQKADARKYNSLESFRQLFRDNKHRLNPKHALHIFPDRRVMRDLSIAVGALTFFTDESSEQRAFRREVFEWMEPNAPVWGWTYHELDFVQDMSLYGNFTIPSDHSSNLSYYIGVRNTVRLKQPHEDGVIEAETGKHYLAIVVSDGDNVQWVTRNFFTDPNRFYGNRLRRNNENDWVKQFRMSWTFPPILGDAAKSIVEHIYSNTRAGYDSFIAGVSGIGYGNLMDFPLAHLPAFAEVTAQHMRNTDISVLGMLDNLGRMMSKAQAEEKTLEEYAAERLKLFAEHDQIKGGIWQMDPNRYESGQGRVFWSEGKPFVSVRLSMWHEQGNSAVTNNWIDGYASRINGYARDYNMIDGYTVLNIHPWSINNSNINYLVSRLADHVEIVTAGELIDMITRNVSPVYRVPENSVIRA